MTATTSSSGGCRSHSASTVFSQKCGSLQIRQSKTCSTAFQLALIGHQSTRKRVLRSVEYQSVLLDRMFMALATAAIEAFPSANFCSNVLPFNGQESPLMPYDFAYTVYDQLSGNDYAHQERTDGQVVRGSYRVLLPDSRVQTVTYVSGPDGHVAQVSYSGKAQYPPPGPYVPAPSKAVQVPVAPPTASENPVAATVPPATPVPILVTSPISIDKNIDSSRPEQPAPAVQASDYPPTKTEDPAPQKPEYPATVQPITPNPSPPVKIVTPAPAPVAVTTKTVTYPLKTIDYPQAVKSPPAVNYKPPPTKPIAAAPVKPPASYSGAVKAPKSQYSPPAGSNYWKPIKSEYAPPKAAPSAPIKIKAIYSAPVPASYAAPVKVVTHYGPPVAKPTNYAAPVAARPVLPVTSYSAPKSTYSVPVPKATYGVPVVQAPKKAY